MKMKYILSLSFLFATVLSFDCKRCESKKSNPAACIVLLQENERCAQEAAQGGFAYLDSCSALQYGAGELCSPREECDSNGY